MTVTPCGRGPLEENTVTQLRSSPAATSLNGAPGGPIASGALSTRMLPMAGPTASWWALDPTFRTGAVRQGTVHFLRHSCPRRGSRAGGGAPLPFSSFRGGGGGGGRRGLQRQHRQASTHTAGCRVKGGPLPSTLGAHRWRLGSRGSFRFPPWLPRSSPRLTASVRLRHVGGDPDPAGSRLPFAVACLHQRSTDRL